MFLFSVCSLHLYGPVSQGKENADTMKIVHESLMLGYQMAMTGNFQNLLPNIERLNRRLFVLPPSCQALFQQISANFKNRYNPNTTICMSGVCCGPLGCL